jgi:hypothetical protein
MNQPKPEQPTPYAKIQERKRRIVENHWKGATIIMRGKFMSCQIKRIHDRMINNEPLRAIILPTPLQAMRMARGLPANPDDRKDK